MYIAQVCWIHDGKNGIAGTHGTIDIHEVQIIPRKGKKFPSRFKLFFTESSDFSLPTKLALLAHTRSFDYQCFMTQRSVWPSLKET